MKYLKFDKALYGVDGLIDLVRADDWNLPAKIVDLISGVEFPVDLSDVTGVSGFIPAASGGAVTALVTIADAMCGNVLIKVSAANSPAVQLSEVGLVSWVTMTRPSGLMTLVPTDSPLVVRDRGDFGP